VTAGSILDKTRTELMVWFEAAWHVTTAKNCLAAKTLERTQPVGGGGANRPPRSVDWRSPRSEMSLARPLTAPCAGRERGRLRRQAGGVPVTR